MSRRSLPLLAVLAVAVGACHDEGGSRPEAVATVDRTPPPRLTAEERRRLRVSEGRIQTHCVRVSRSLVDRRKGPTPAQEARAFAAADDFVAVIRAKPTALVDVGQDARLYLGDVIENIEGSNCDPRMVDRLERALVKIPAE